MSIIKKLYKHGHLDLMPEQEWVTDTHYEVMAGSIAYGVSADSSDMDIHAITTPPVEIVFPHTTGWIRGFGDSAPNFEHYEKHHIKAFEKDYDVSIHSIIRFFDLAMENNPNILDMLWVPDNCILHMDTIGEIIRRNRTEFLHKGSMHRLLGYSHQQLKRLENSKRTELIEEYGYDTKFAYHVVRLTLQAQQILETGDMDFSEHSDYLKAVRKGAFTTKEELMEWYRSKEKHLNHLYDTGSLRRKPDTVRIKEILMSCLEQKFGSLDMLYKGAESDTFRKLEAIRRIVNS